MLVEAVLLVVGALVVVHLLLVARWKRLDKKMGHITGPAPRPFFGSVFCLGLHKVHTVKDLWDGIGEYMGKYGKVYRVWIGPKLWIIISDPLLIEKCLSKGDVLEKGNVYDMFKVYTSGLFVAKGERWKAMRKALVAAMSPKIINDFYLEQVGAQVHTCLESLAHHEDKFFDPHPIITRYLCDIVTRTHFSVKTKEQIQGSDLVHDTSVLMIRSAFERMLTIWMWPEALFKMSRNGREAMRAGHQFHGFVRQIVEEWRDKYHQQKLPEAVKYAKYPAAVEELLTSEWGRKPSLDELTFALVDLVIAALDTTGSAVCWTLYFLATNQEYQERVYQEAVEVLDQGLPLQDTLRNLPVTENALRETLRLIMPGTVKEMATDLNADGVTLPKGASIYFFTHQMHRSKDFWQHPDQYYPDHFLPEHVAARPKFSYVPFGVGHKSCPGKYFSNVMAKSLIARIIRHYRVETDIPLEKMEYSFVFLLEPLHGHSIRFIRRS